MSLSVIILSAGSGSRMKSDTPKVLHTVCGESMLSYSIEEALKVSDDITVVLYHQAERIRTHIESQFDNISIVLQDHLNYPGTGGAVMGIKTRHDKVLVLNGDMPLVCADELEKFLEIDADIVMSVIELDNPSGYGRVVIESGEVQRIVEEKDANEAQKAIQSVNAGVYLFKSDILITYLPQLNNNNKQQEYYLTDIVELSKNDGKVIKPLIVDEENFKGVNTKYDLAHAEEIMQRRIKKAWMQQGVIMRLPETIFIDSRVELVGECEIESGVVLKGCSVIECSHIKANSVVEDATIIESQIGPMARIRPQSTITQTHIGNFVEVKKSSLNGVKAGHLSYIGDSEIDEGSNIGAGVITCNYDGKAKYKTQIGKNVFIGSDSQLVAPVHIEDDVLIAAGTTVTSDVKRGDLAVSRTPLKHVKGFFYKFFGANR
jgi:bifunctional UDP-N-acetylglucosamine pyrophosphorylase/glucosamine-1-phosphate N-acetyltransferase